MNDIKEATVKLKQDIIATIVFEKYFGDSIQVMYGTLSTTPKCFVKDLFFLPPFIRMMQF